MSRIRLQGLCWLALCLLLAGCGGGRREVDLSSSPLGLVSPLATPTLQRAAQATASPQPEATAPTAGAAPVQLVILHTNDNWGETEPCG